MLNESQDPSLVSSKPSSFPLFTTNTTSSCKNTHFITYKNLINQAESFERFNNVERALVYYKRAHSMYPSKKEPLQKIEELSALQENLNKQTSSEFKFDTVKNLWHIENTFNLSDEIYNQLLDHQKSGVAWLWKIHNCELKGGLLGDDMGLGKTIQVITLLIGLISNKLISSALIVVPKGLLDTWKNEFKKWAPSINIRCLLQNNSQMVQLKFFGIYLTTYGTILANSEKLIREDFVWDYIILDEGQCIKNYRSKSAMALKQIEANHRLLLSGTPIQNRLDELWSLFYFLFDEKLLGTRANFRSCFERPIMVGHNKDATVGEKKYSQRLAQVLREIIEPYLLRREKKLIMTSKDENEIDETEDGFVVGLKNEIAVWSQLTKAQIAVYDLFLTSQQVSAVLNKSQQALTALIALKKICDHPYLLMSHDLEESNIRDILGSYSESDMFSPLSYHLYSGKLAVTVDIVRRLKEEGHRVLIFSQSVKMLDIIEKTLIFSIEGLKLVRMDGTMQNLSDRKNTISKFNYDNSITCFLLTTKVGGIGLTLTAADRVIIFDPSWNPSTDNQAVDRVFRIGQRKNVVIYRLLTCGTIEEKIYRRQIFKNLIQKTALENEQQMRYFSKQDLIDLFSFKYPSRSLTQEILETLHQCEMDIELDLLKTIDNVISLTNHSLLYSKKLPLLPVDDETIQRSLLAKKSLAVYSSSLPSKLTSISESNANSHSFPLTSVASISKSKAVNNQIFSQKRPSFNPLDSLNNGIQKLKVLQIPFPETSNQMFTRNDAFTGFRPVTYLQSANVNKAKGKARSANSLPPMSNIYSSTMTEFEKPKKSISSSSLENPFVANQFDLDDQNIIFGDFLVFPNTGKEPSLKKKINQENESNNTFSTKIDSTVSILSSGSPVKIILPKRSIAHNKSGEKKQLVYLDDIDDFDIEDTKSSQESVMKCKGGENSFKRLIDLTVD